MNILCLRSDKPDAELYLIIDGKVHEVVWKAHKELSITLHSKIEELLDGSGLEIKDIGGLVIYKGPGSFTGLRIGATVFNTLADSLGIPIVGSKTSDWLKLGSEKVMNNVDHKVVLPDYGGEANITKPRK